MLFGHFEVQIGINDIIPKMHFFQKTLTPLSAIRRILFILSI